MTLENKFPASAGDSGSIPEDVSICAVVVSFNRKTLLMRSLTALLNQSRPLEKIIIVDNASTDGTSDLLKEKGFLAKENIEFHVLSENLGGAGGFKTGVELAFNAGYDWIWLMDDDGFATDDCLEKLLGYTEQFDYFGPLVVDEKDKQTLSFPINFGGNILRTLKDVTRLKLTSPILHNVIIPFNGVLIKKELVAKIGFPDARFFIWGDDINYTYRIQAERARVATIENIVFFHPRADLLGEPMFFGKMHFNDTESMLKLYCMCRNNTYNLKAYRGILYALAFSVKVIWFFTFTKFSFKKLRFCLKAIYHGFTKDFGYHKQYIGKSNEW